MMSAEITIPPVPASLRAPAYTAAALSAREQFVRGAAEAWSKAGHTATASRPTAAADALAARIGQSIAGSEGCPRSRAGAVRPAKRQRGPGVPPRLIPDKGRPAKMPRTKTDTATKQGAAAIVAIGEDLHERVSWRNSETLALRTWRSVVRLAHRSKRSRRALRSNPRYHEILDFLRGTPTHTRDVLGRSREPDRRLYPIADYSRGTASGSTAERLTLNPSSITVLALLSSDTQACRSNVLARA